ncbi:MAG: hypothetical protein ABFE13_14145 [Phycisphaerales bacterium]
MRTTCLMGMGFFALVAAIVMVSLPHEVERNHTVAKSFSSAASWIDDFIKANGRLPDSDEYEAWAASQPEHFYGVQSIYLLDPSSSEFYQEAVDAFGPAATTPSYVLARWMGEWNEYYASWAGRSTVDDSLRYYGTILLFGVFNAVVAAVCWYVARKCRTSAQSQVAGSDGRPCLSC